MSEFLDPLIVKREKPVDTDANWIVMAEFRYQSDLVGLITIPPTDVTDFASVPRAPFIFWLCGDTSTEASVIHDYLYSTKQFPRKTADDVLKEASIASAVPHWRAWLMWLGVRVFGGSHWK